MLKQLSNLVLAFSLIAGGWGCVLAAALCGHTDCSTSSDSAGHGSHAPEVDESVGRGAHGGHAAADDHGGHPEHGPATVEQSEHDSPHETRPSGRWVPDVSPCGHCVSGPRPLSSSVSEQQAGQPQRQDGAGVNVTARRVAPPERGFTPLVIPSQGAPPGRVSTHVLNSVFRI